jgi:hypothetical protein
VDFAHERQSQCDPVNEPYYYECIQEITKQRSSDELQLKTIMLESKGLVSRRALSEAYKFFDLPADGGAADDDRIFNIFQAQHADLPTEHQERAREMIGRIGRRRGSKLLMNASQQTIETAQEAYAWLGNGLGPETDDSFVVAVFSLRVSQTRFLPSGERTSTCQSCTSGTSRSNLSGALTSFRRPRGTKTWKRSVAKQYQLSRVIAEATISTIGYPVTRTTRHR